MSGTRRNRRRKWLRARRRAVVVVQVVVTIGVLMSFAALTLDVGTLYRARAELQSAADSAALAAATALASDAMIEARYGNGSITVVQGSATSRANFVAMLNQTLNDPTKIASGDIQTGYINLNSSSEPLDTGAGPAQVNAVRVFVASGGEGANQPVEFFFAPIFGRLLGETSASAVAAFDDRFQGFDSGDADGNILPFTVHENVFQADLIAGSDQYAYDADLGGVLTQPDGIREVNIYPHVGGPGNFGLLNIGTPNQGEPALADHIENGVPPEDFEAETGSAVLVFFEADGSAVTYAITGDPGMKTSLESSVETRVGEVVGFFLHIQATESGSNLTYTIAAMRFGRLMGVSLTGNPSARGIWVQPVAYSGPGVQLGPGAGHTGGLVGRLVLAR